MTTHSRRIHIPSVKAVLTYAVSTINLFSALDDSTSPRPSLLRAPGERRRDENEENTRRQDRRGNEKKDSINTMNILYVMTDQQRFDSASVYGLSKCQTPNLDRLMNSGARFDNAYSCCSLCSPARASMLTGLYPHSHGMWTNNDNFAFGPRNLPEGTELISQPLANAGYQCGYAGKWHCGGDKLPRDYAFEGMNVPDYGIPYDTDEYIEYARGKGVKRPEYVNRIEDPVTGDLIAAEATGGEAASAPAFVADHAMNMIRRFEDERRRSNRPWFTFVSFWGPHHPFRPPSEYANMYEPDDVELPKTLREKLDGKPATHQRMRNGAYFASRLPDSTWRRIIALSHAQCTLVDAQLGKLLDLLDELNVANETVVLFSTDHGDMRGAHGGFHDKGPVMYEDTYHIPLAARWPGLGSPGSVRPEFVLNMDLAATALEAAGLDVPTNYQARGLKTLLQGSAENWRDDVFCEFHGHRFPVAQRMVRWDCFKYVFNPACVDEFYDLNSDPDELENLIDVPRQARNIAEGRQRMLRWMDETNDELGKYVAQKMFIDA